MACMVRCVAVALAIAQACVGQGAEDLLPHSPILISGDGAFTAENGIAGGSGTEEDPFVVVGLHIDANGERCGILVENVTQHILLRDCHISGASRYGIRVVDSVGPVVEGCLIEGADYGILLDTVDHARIEGNTFFGNAECSIYTENSSDNVVCGNVFTEVTRGLCILGESTNTLIHDNVFHNCGIGVSILSKTGGNRIYRNDFIGCTATSLSFNFWDDGHGTGNYWEDYVGNDTDGDGFGDEPYLIKFLEQEAKVYTCWEYDYHPALQPFHWMGEESLLQQIRSPA